MEDRNTNFVYLADELPKKYPAFFDRFTKILSDEKVDFDLIPGTKDVWAVDFMPIQVGEANFVRFKYSPDYLIKYKKEAKTITDTDTVCRAMGIESHKSDIVLDGGNVVRFGNRVIMTRKIFSENPNYTDHSLLIKELKGLLHCDEITFIPKESEDDVGHSDGYVRFINEKAVFVSNYQPYDRAYYIELRKSLHDAGLATVSFPLNYPKNGDNWDANGLYINYLQINGKIFLPTFGLDTDEEALKTAEEHFKGHSIIPVRSNEPAVRGGVLNCLTWNVFLPQYSATVDELLPIATGGLVLVVLEEDHRNNEQWKDLYCFALNLEKSYCPKVWGAGRFLKQGYYEYISGVQEIKKYRDLISKAFSRAEISRMVYELREAAKTDPHRFRTQQSH